MVSISPDLSALSQRAFGGDADPLLALDEIASAVSLHAGDAYVADHILRILAERLSARTKLIEVRAFLADFGTNDLVARDISRILSAVDDGQVAVGA